MIVMKVNLPQHNSDDKEAIDVNKFFVSYGQRYAQLFSILSDDL